MSAALLGMIADLQAQIEALEARCERVEERVTTEWVSQVAGIAVDAYRDRVDGLRVIEGGNQ